MNIVIIGGSSSSTPALFEYFSQLPAKPSIHVTLAGRNLDHLRAVSRAARMLEPAEPVNIVTVLVGSSEYLEALKRAALVILQVRIGGYRGRMWDETFPLRYASPGDEGLGFGGLAAAWRSWPVIKELVAEVILNAPQAFLILLSSPIGIILNAIHATFRPAKVAGICELPWTALIEICQTAQANPHNVHFGYFGLTHLGWFYFLKDGDRDLVQEILQRRKKNSDFPSGPLLQRYRGVPTRYLRLHFENDLVVSEQRGAEVTRGGQLGELSREMYGVYQTGNRSEILKAISLRAAPWYREAIGPLILALCHHESQFPFFLSFADKNRYADFPDNAVIEEPCRIVNGEIVRVANPGPIPSAIKDLTRMFIRHEKIAAEAVCSQDADCLKEAICSHPWYSNCNNLNSILGDIQNKGIYGIR